MRMRTGQWIAGMALVLGLQACVPTNLPATLLGSSGGLVTRESDAIISNNTGGIVSNNTGSLVGVAKAPATIISNNAGNYRIQALSQVPLANAQVTLVNAQGTPLTDDKGQILKTTTDAQGRYRFTGIAIARNTVVSVQLPADKGHLEAIALPTTGTENQVDLDLVSTLTTGYILDQYVLAQADPDRILERLTAVAEAQARQKADTALATSTVSLPDRLTRPRAVETVRALRQSSTDFDATMEEVRKLLVAAGQSDMGTGRLATEVDFAGIQGVKVTPDNSIYLVPTHEPRIYRVDPQGRLSVVAGSTMGEPGTLLGKLATEAGLHAVSDFTFDAEGRLWLIDRKGDGRLTRILRVALDGRIDVSIDATGKNYAVSIAVGPQGVYVAGYGPQLVRVWPGSMETVHSFGWEGEDMSVGVAACDAQGRLIVGVAKYYESGPTFEYLRFDPATSAQSRIPLDGYSEPPSIDDAGNIFFSGKDSSGTWVARYEDGKALQRVLEGSTLRTPLNIAGAPDGSVVLGEAYNGLVYRIRANQATLVAGIPEGQAKPGQVLGSADSVALEQMRGLVVTPDGELYIAETFNNRILHVGLDKQVRVLAVSDKTWYAQWLRMDGSKRLYILSSDFKRFDVGSTTPKRIFSQWPGGYPYEYTVAPDGSLYVLFDDRFEAFGPDGTPRGLITTRVGNSGRGVGMACDPAGNLYLAFDGKLMRWSASSGLQLLRSDDVFGIGCYDKMGMAVDAAGRVYMARDNRIHRYDPAGDRLEILAGPGGRLFNGSGVDDGLLAPNFPCLDGQGNFYIADTGHKQIKRIPASSL